MSIIPYGADAGSAANTYSVTPSSGLGSGPPAAGDAVLVKIRSGGGNTGSATLTVKYGSTNYTAAITLANGSVIPPGLLAGGQMVLFTYDGSHWQLAEATVSAYLTVDQFGAVGRRHDVRRRGDRGRGHRRPADLHGGQDLRRDDELTINTQAVFAPGSAITVAMMQTVTFTAPPQAGPYYFQGMGTVNVSGPVRVDWYGAKANGMDDSVKIGLAALQPEFIFSSGKTYTILANATYVNQAVFEPGSAISVSSTFTVTFQIPPQAGPFTIFSGPGDYQRLSGNICL